MAPGDAVFFWMGGDSDVRGIYGFGHITSLPYEDGDSHKVKVHVTKRLRRHIGIEKIKQHPALQNLMILKIAVGSNFLLSGAEGDALAEMTRKEA